MSQTERTPVRETALRRLIAPVIALAFGLTLGGLLAEAAVLVLVGEQPKFPRHVVGGHFGVRINEPSSTYRHKSADMNIWFRINGNGLRADEDYSYVKPGNTKRIISLGDSYTFGHEVDVHQTFSAILERELRKQGIPVEVLNAGVSGYGTAEALLYLERELLRYEPDAVLLTFYGNDLVDNVRAGLFKLDGSQLVQLRAEYVPLGSFGNFMNTNPVVNLLTERSNAFNFVKERVTELLKRQAVRENEETVEAAGDTGSTSTPGTAQDVSRRRLTAALLERLYSTTRARQIPLVIQSIPFSRKTPRGLVEAFPLEEFNVSREALFFLPAKPLLEPHLDKELLYYERSQGHWTPFSHDVSGNALAHLFVSERILQ